MLIAQVAAAEIIPPAAMVDVYVRPSPFRQEKVHICKAAGLTIEEIVGDCGEECAFDPRFARLHVTINGHAIERRNWSRVRVKPGITVNVVRVPAGKAIGKILGAIVSIFAAIVAPYLTTALFGIAAGAAGFSTVTGLIGMGLSLAGSMIVNALFPAPKSNIATDNTKTLYSIGGAQNTASQYGAVPAIFGTHRISPPYAAGSYTELIGDDQYLRMLFCVGYGPMQMSDIKIGETPVSKFEGVTMEVIPNHLVTSPTLYTQPVYEEDVSALLDYASSWITRTTADKVEEISVDVTFPNGVYQLRSSNGQRVNYTVGIEVQYAVTKSENWVGAGSIVVTASSAQALRRTLSWAVPSGQYDVRLRKYTSDNPTADDTVSETAYFAALRGRRKVPAIKFDRPLSIIAMRIKATNELSGSVDQLNLIASPLIRSWNGSAWNDGQVTSNPADHFRNILQGSANARPVSDVGIDIAGLQEWHEYCRVNGLTFNFVSTSQQSVYDQLQQVASAGRAAVSLRDGKWGVVWDVADSAIVQHFTPRNSWDFSSTRAYADLPHGFRVAFINRDNGYLNDERVVYDDGYTEANATKFEGLDFPGVVEKDLIWKHGRYHLAQLRLQRESYELSADFENLVCTRGDRVRVNHDTVLWGLGSARVSSVSEGPDTVTVDDLFLMEAGKTYSMRFRLANGTSVVRQIAGVDGEFKSFTLIGSGALPAQGDLALFGENGLESVVLRVKGITAQPDLSAKIELVDDAPAILQADKGTIPPFETGIPPLVDYRAYAPASLSSTESIWTTSPPTSALLLSWQAPSVGRVQNYIVQYALKGTDLWSRGETPSAPQIELHDLQAGAYDVRIRAVFTNGQLSGWLNGVINAAIFATEPADVTGFVIQVTGDLATLQWDAIPPETGISHYELRYSPVASALVTWQSALVLRSVVTTAQAQVPPLKGVYLVKAVSYSGLQSRNAAIIVSTIDGLTAFNAVEEREEEAPFAGAKSGVYFDGHALRLDVMGDVFARPDFFGVADFYLSDGGYLASGTYDFEDVIDLGEIYTSRVSAQINAFGEWSSDDVFALPDIFAREDFFGGVGSLWDVSMLVSVTDDDPALAPVWSEWTPFVAGDLSGRAYRFRAALESRQADVTPVVESISVTVDMPDRVIAGNDIVIPVSGLAVAFSPPLKHLQGVSIAAQGLATGDYYTITGKTEAGFTIAFKNAAGGSISRTLDYVAKGYGTVQ